MLVTNANSITLPSVLMAGPNTIMEATNSYRGTSSWNADSDMYLSGVDIWKYNAGGANLCGFKLIFIDMFGVKPQ
jgi:hypothetical protein